MSRELKFRAWYEKRMSLPFTLLEDKAKFEDGVILHRSSMGIAEIMQFTGLHDKNGKEIWEGDVIDIHGDRYEVRQDKSGAWIYDEFKAFPKTGIISWDMLSSEIEVLGNIYESPELLHPQEKG